MWLIAWVARRQPAARASAGGLPSSQAGRKPAAKASPPPVPSTTLSIGSALTVIGSARPLVYQRAPSAPSLITTWGYQAVSTLAAASGSSRPVRASASSALTISRRVPWVHSKNGSAPARLRGEEEPPSTEIDMLALPAR